jgi:hypothetical protein
LNWLANGQTAQWPALAAACLIRAAAAHAVAVHALDAPIKWALVPVQDLLSFGFWIAGFDLLNDGRFELVS